MTGLIAFAWTGDCTFLLPKIFVDRHLWPDSHEIVLIVLVFLEIALVLGASVAVEIGEFGDQVRENVAHFFVRLVFELQ